MITKEQIIAKMESIKIDRELELKCQGMLNEIEMMYKEVGLTAPGILVLKIDPAGNTVGVLLKPLDELSLLPIYQVTGIECVWDAASWEIFKRNVKDVFYDIRKKVKEQITENKKVMPWWKKLWTYIKGEK